jgi:hypothetical protein
VLRRVARLVGPVEAASLDDGGGRGRRRAFRGAVDGRAFSMRRVLSSGRASPVAVRGEVAPDRGGTRIRVRLALAGAVPIALLAGVVAGGAAAAWLGLGAARGGELAGAWLGFVLVYPFAAAAILLRIAWERARVRHLLRYLTGELTHAGLAHELAGARE